MIRWARDDDASEIHKLLGELGYSEQSLSEIRTKLAIWLKRTEACVLVDDSAGSALAGLAVLVAVPAFETSGFWGRLEVLVVSEGFRRRGIGRELLGAAVREAGRMGCTSVEVTSGRWRHAAQGFYNALSVPEVSTRYARFIIDCANSEQSPSFGSSETRA